MSILKVNSIIRKTYDVWNATRGSMIKPGKEHPKEKHYILKQWK